MTATPVGGGTPVIDLYDCPALTGRADYPALDYDVDIDITTQGGGTVYASSLTQVADITVNDAAVDENFIDDGGRVLFDWVLVGSTNQQLSCTQAGAVKVGFDGTPTGSLPPFTDDFPCADGTGVSNPMLSSTYTLAFDALNAAGGGIGANSTTKTNVVITDPNGYTNLGTVMILAE